MTRPYHLVEAKEAECSFCGKTAICAVLVANEPERETGYIDEVYLCRDCEDKAAI